MARLVYFFLGLFVGRWLSELMRKWAQVPAHDESTPSPLASAPVPGKSAAQGAAVVSDDLTQITGLGPAAATALNDIGIWTFAQLAAQSDEELVRRLPTRVAARAQRDKWIEQAKKLSAK